MVRSGSAVKKHAPYFDLVQEAIKATQKPAKGASRQAIVSYLSQNYGSKLGPTFTTTLRTVLRRFVDSGKLIQSKGPSGSFRVNKEQLEKPKKKKAAKKSTSTKKKSTDKKKKSTDKKKKSGAKKTKSKTKAKPKSSGKKANKPKKAGDKKRKQTASKTKKKAKSGSKPAGKRASSPGTKRQRKLSSKN
mmetsp:Transcript_143223/g.202530  ORF Transcript_143223/g.202530 Transcript_143223/m.202530 type:complete len:189 (+) Transcript_143223:79-645(+)